MFGDLDWPLNASRGLSAIAEFVVIISSLRSTTQQDGNYTAVHVKIWKVQEAKDKPHDVAVQYAIAWRTP